MSVDGAMRVGAQRQSDRPAAQPDAYYRLLLVEDDAGDALLVEEYLADTSLDHRLRWTQTLADGLAAAAEDPPDCILLDLHLPDAAGVDAVVRVQAALPDAAIIVLTGLAEGRAGSDAVAAGAQDYLVKGQVTGELLERSVRYAASRKHAQRTASELRLKERQAEENSRLERGLLPKPLLRRARVTATSCYLPGREGALLAGDFLDVVETPDGVVHAVIGDVSGHGPDEAAVGVLLRIAWRTMVLSGNAPVDVLAMMETILSAERTYEAMFATVATLTLTPGSSHCEVTLAGHDAPLLIQDGRATQLAAVPGMALGMMPGHAVWQPVRQALPASASLLLHTDGLTEGHTGAGPERLGTEGLVSVIGSAPDPSGQALIDHLTATTRRMDAGRHLDDVAMLLLTW
ncbi:PP2C family protein-serine/threonine phosphatase [Actinacidiphila yeochonensis]|uniref:PP2C family protein-serine/threonine phosphatase n=1 Tax=Actinacidiphila yeochonensis TaxID=89050 RepID=UPI000B1AA915|nr:fused response regulator/phosphatase [Actinacidiphila yeochonensis]